MLNACSKTSAKSTAKIVITESQCAVLNDPVAPYKRNDDAHVMTVLSIIKLSKLGIHKNKPISY